MPNCTRIAAVLLCLAGLFALSATHAQTRPVAVAIDDDDIGGVVRSAKGPEAGVWVIAETNELPTRFIRIVVTDEQGRYLVPDLPRAKYSVWVRGYGLVDSKKVTAEPGTQLNLRAVTAPSERAAAQYYPAIHWYSMLKIPEAKEFGGKSLIPAKMTLHDYLNGMKSNGCIGCHQIGQRSTRTIPRELGKFSDSTAAWARRIQSGQAGELMINQIAAQMGGAPLKYLADWTARIARGELPHTRPQRPQGPERNIVVTLWDWMSEKKYLHDLIASDRRHPTVNAYGPLYGSPEYASDTIPILDPRTHRVTTFTLPVRDADTPLALGPGHAAALDPLQPSAYWGNERIWDTRANNHNSMIDRQGRVWMAAAVRGPDNPQFCKKGSDHPSAKITPVERANRHLSVLDPKTMQYRFVDTCFSTHHLQFAYDANDTLWTSGGGPVVGWLNTKVFDETGDAAKAQGWTALVLDSNGNGRRDEHTEPGQPGDPAKDRRIIAGFYAVMPSPVDGSIWGSIRTGRGGVVWASLASGHLASFDRRKCKGPLNGPKATGDHCPEGWSFHQYPGPGFKGIGENSAESSYYTWVDQHNTFGLGEDVPMSTGNLNDGLIAWKDGRMIVLRVPYPMGFYAKGFDGRIDDPQAGWKGRGLWTASGDRTPWLMEGGKGSKPKAVHFQFRPDPLAK